MPRDEDLAELARRTAIRPVPLWIRALAIVAYVDTTLIALSAAMLVHDILLFGGKREDELTPVFLVPIVAALVMFAPLVRGGRASRWLRLVVVVVVAHVVLLPAIAILLRHPSLPPVPNAWAAPAGAIVGLAVFAFAGAWTAFRGGVPRAMHALVAFFLTLSLVYGLALPFAARAAGTPDAMRLRGIVVLSVLPAIAVAAWVARAERPLPRVATRAIFAVAALFAAGAIFAMPPMRTDAFFAFVRGLDVLLGCAFVSVASIVALALMTWWGLREASRAPPLDPPRVVAGTVDAKDAVVGWFRYLGVLRGARPELAAFDLHMDGAALRIAPGATLVAALPDDALDPVAGDRIPALHVGDRVIVSGFVAPTRQDFRTRGRRSGRLVGGAAGRAGEAQREARARLRARLRCRASLFVIVMARAIVAARAIVVRNSSSSESRRDRVLAERAFAMRKAPTASEALLFEALRGGRLGVAFRRQVPLLGRYIADLFAPEVRLVVEVDGGYHAAQARADAKRDRALERAGYRVVRVSAESVMRDIDAAAARVREAIEAARR